MARRTTSPSSRNTPSGPSPASTPQASTPAPLPVVNLDDVNVTTQLGVTDPDILGVAGPPDQFFTSSGDLAQRSASDPDVFTILETDEGLRGSVDINLSGGTGEDKALRLDDFTSIYDFDTGKIDTTLPYDPTDLSVFSEPYGYRNEEELGLLDSVLDSIPFGLGGSLRKIGSIFGADAGDSEYVTYKKAQAEAQRQKVLAGITSFTSQQRKAYEAEIAGIDTSAARTFSEIEQQISEIRTRYKNTYDKKVAEANNEISLLNGNIADAVAKNQVTSGEHGPNYSLLLASIIFNIWKTNEALDASEERFEKEIAAKERAQILQQQGAENLARITGEESRKTAEASRRPAGGALDIGGFS